MSKGDRPRPYSIPLKTFDNNWDAIFGKKDKQVSNEAEDKPTRNNEETQEVLRHSSSVGRATD